MKVAQILHFHSCENTGLGFGQKEFTVCNSDEEIPGRWDLTHRSRSEALAEIDRCAGILARGVEALSGLYLRICDQIRDHHLTDDEIRQVLSPHFPAPRVSEFIRVANAPPETYRRYKAGLVGFRAVLQECRGYRILDDEHRKRKKIRRAAERLIGLLGHGEVTVCGRRVTVA